MILPRHYNARLQRSHPRVRVRWSAHLECWLVEQQIARARLPQRYRGMAPDTVIRLNEGYTLIGRYAPRALPPVERLIRFLTYTSTERLGLTGEQLATMIDTQTEVVEERRQAQVRRHLGDVSVDAWEDFTRMAGSRSLPRSNAARA